jgi:hypothetical protein
LIVSGRVAAGIGAELGAMKVTEQVDAMEASAVDPHKYLAATRILSLCGHDPHIGWRHSFRMSPGSTTASMYASEAFIWER